MFLIERCLILVLLLKMADSDEVLREAACVGNIDSVRKLVQMGASVNSQNIVNGW